MTIEILPARLANQIAAGEVVERPASVIKELVENSLDADATAIHIEVDKGGVKRIRISDNGAGIVKEELTLALSRHATSKIKNLNDLEAIDSLGFRGEALASISSVARLSLISKPKSQSTAWQANAEGRDMVVTITPAAHPDGTTIEVLDLFFNTPARRKFLRTAKTEFNHIDEVIRRIALARFDVTFTLTHNGKTVRHYRAASNNTQNAKRVAMVCGQKFIDNAIEVDCQHDNMRFMGWLAKPSFARNQNDLSYSYVNGRMMRDKLINHAIRQAYANLLPSDTYPAFVLFLQLDYQEVDVNVHPAKHEVRFHQSRYVHDFIYSVCHNALIDSSVETRFNHETQVASSRAFLKESPEDSSIASSVNSDEDDTQYIRPDYVQPLQQVKEPVYTPNLTKGSYGQRDSISRAAVNNYQQLMDPIIVEQPNDKAFDGHQPTLIDNDKSEECFFLMIKQGGFGVFKAQNSLKILSLFELSYQINQKIIIKNGQKNQSGSSISLVSQPLLLPVMLTLSKEQIATVENYHSLLELAGVVCVIQKVNNGKQQLQIRQFPAILRERDVSVSFITIINTLMSKYDNDSVSEQTDTNNIVISGIAKAMIATEYSIEQAQALWLSAKKSLSIELIDRVLLNSVPLDLTSEIKQLKAKLQIKKN
jgi:DNA mismatch repair protein MutL